MKSISIIMCLVFSSSAFSNMRDLSLGIVLGTPFGISAKYELSEENSIYADVSTGYSALDYMWLDPRNFDVKNLRWLYGLGGVVGNGIGARGVTGVEYEVPDYPFHAMANISMALVKDKDVKSILGVALGARYEF